MDRDRAAIRAVLAQAKHDLLTYEETAVQLERIIGLTESQTKAVLNYEKALKNSGVKDAQIVKLSDKYASKLLNYRAETISLTESSNATNQAWTDYVQDAERRGVLPADQYQLRWLATPSDRTCDECMSMNGATGEISTGLVEGTKPPLHPRCRCVLVVDKK